MGKMASVEELRAIIANTGYAYPMEITKVRPNAVCCGDADDSANRLSNTPWRSARLFVGMTINAGTSLVFAKTSIVVNQNGPDEINAVIGGTDGLSDQYLEEKGALIPSNCFFAIIGFGVEVLAMFQTPTSTQAGAGDPTYLEFFGSEGVDQTYNKQAAMAMLTHSHMEWTRKGNSCSLASGALKNYASDTGINNTLTTQAGVNYTNQIAFMRSPIVVSGVNESNALQLKWFLDHNVTISNHAANPIPPAAANTQYVLPIDFKMYGVSLPPSMACV